MRRLIYVFFAIMLISVTLISNRVEAAGQITTRENVFKHLKEAFQAQISLSEQFRTYPDVENVLSPYFGQSYIQHFLEENLYEEEEGYIVYGSDFAMYYVPYFSYDNDTKVIFNHSNDKIYVYELF